MDEERFSQLMESIRHCGEHLRGERYLRTTFVDEPGPDHPVMTTEGICEKCYSQGAVLRSGYCVYCDPDITVTKPA